MFSVVDNIFNISAFITAESDNIFSSLRVNVKAYIQCNVLPLSEVGFLNIGCDDVLGWMIFCCEWLCYAL